MEGNSLITSEDISQLGKKGWGTTRLSARAVSIPSKYNWLRE